MKTVLSIAGSDSSGGAGIQADIKTCCAHKVFGLTAVTAITAQNTLGIQNIKTVDAKLLRAQLESIFSDIKIDAVKIGMIYTAAQIKVVAELLKKYDAKNVVLDTVLFSTSGTRLMKKSACRALEKYLLPAVTLCTPNRMELEFFSKKKISSPEEIKSAAAGLAEKYGTSVLAKGGHNIGNADDLLIISRKKTAGNMRSEQKVKSILLEGKRFENPNTHGTGCTLSSAIACNLASGMGLEDSVRNAKSYVYKLISSPIKIGHGRGPMNHMACS